MTVSVVIPTLDAGAMLGRCVEGILGSPGIEVIVVDNGSTDRSVVGLRERYPSVRFIANLSNVGFARAVDQGVDESDADYVLLLNTDATITTGDINTLLAAADADPAGAAWQPIVVDDSGWIENAGEYFTRTGFFVRDLEPSRSSEPYAVFSATAACLLVRRSAFSEVGGLRASYFAYIEDVDLCWRLRLRGWEVRVVPAARAHHQGSATTRRIFAPHEVRFLTFRNRFRTLLSNASVSTLITVIPCFVIICLVTAGALSVRGDVRSASSIAGALVWPLRNWSTVRSDRAQAQTIRCARDAVILRADLRRGMFTRRLHEMFKVHQTRW